MESCVGIVPCIKASATPTKDHRTKSKALHLRLAALAGLLSLAAGQTSQGSAACATSALLGPSALVVEDTAGAFRLAQAVNCSGGSFDVAWIGHVMVEETIHVLEGTTLNITGSADRTSIADGGGQIPLFQVDGGGGALHLSDLTLANGSAEFGGALLAIEATITLNGCIFLANEAAEAGGAVLLFASELDAKDVSFARNSAQYIGGALYADGSRITLDGLLGFFENKVDGVSDLDSAIGGGVYLFDSSVTAAGRVEFVGNTAMNGGAAYVDVSTLVFDGPLLLANNSASAVGGGIWGEDSDITVAGSAVLKGNTAESYFGGGMALYACAISVSNVTEFIENSAGSSGGGIAMSNTVLVFDGPVSFSGNSADSGGGAVLVEDTSFLVFGGPLVFEHNSARDGGALDCRESNLTVLGGAVWQHNQANETDGFGGAMRLINSTVSMSNSTEFGSNVAEFGGAMGVLSSLLVLDGPTLFSNNSASSDGGAILSFLSNINITMNAAWNNNRAGYLGGAVFAENSVVRITGEAEFWRNSAVFGGAFGMKNTRLIVDGTLNCTGNVVRGSGELGNGGAIYTERSVILVAGFVSMDENAGNSGGGMYLSTSTMEVSSQLRCAGNTAVTGGAIAVVASVLLVEGTAHFSGNFASEGGGAAFVLLDSAVNIAGDALFEDNSASVAGGGMLLFNSSLTVLVDGGISFDRNSAADGGGLSVYSDANMTVLGEARFTNNAGNTGGALKAFEFSTLRLAGTSVTMTGNYAVSSGGAMECESMTALQVQDVRFISNSAGVNGGAVSMVSVGTAKTITREGDPASFSDCWFEDNAANDTGGAVYVVGGFVTITGTEFHNNTAARAGGAVLVSGAVGLTGCTLTGNQAGIGPAVSNAVTVTLSSTELADNTLTCDDEGLFLDWKNASAYETACEACPEQCSTCTTLDPDRAQLCEPVLEHTTSRTAEGTVASLDLDPGYWRTSSTSKDIRECYHGPACIGGSDGDSYCGAGYEGPFCAVCADGYTAGVGYACVKCTGSRRGATIAVISVIVLVAIAAAVAVGVRHHRSSSGSTPAEESSLMQWLSMVKSRMKRSGASQAFKTIIVSWQIVTQFASVASVTYPELYGTFLEYISVVNLDLTWMMSAGCLIDTDFYASLLVTTIGPLVVAGLILLSRTILRRKYADNQEKRSKIDSRHASAMFWLSFLVYSATSAVIFQTFACDDLDNGDSYLRVDHSVQCYTSRHNGFMWYAGAMSMVYPFGIPACYAAVLYNSRAAIKSEQHEAAGSTLVLRELWEPYQKHAYYYEVVECLRRVVLSGVVVFVLPNTAGQIATSFLLSMGFFIVFMVLDPLLHRSDTWLGIIAHMVVMLSMFSGLLEKVDIEGDDSFSQSLFAVVLILAHASMVVFLVVESFGVSCVMIKELAPSHPQPRGGRVGGRMVRQSPST